MAVEIQSVFAHAMFSQSLAGENKRMSRIINNRYDLNGLEIARLAKTVFWGKVVPMGNFQGGPGGRCLAVLALLHYCGYPMYLIIARYGHRLQLLRRIAAKLKK